MSKQAESIWTVDLTPHVVRVMTMDITPDFSSDFWHQDVTYHVVGSLAVFGLVVSSLITTMGVAAVGVQTEVAFANQATASQVAALAMGDNQPASAILLPNASTTGDNDHRVGSSTMGHPIAMGSTTPLFCPKLARTVTRGNHDATTTGDVGQLQEFIAEHFNKDKKDVVTGFFGSTTQALLMQFQQEQGIPPAPFAGPLTRAAIARLCNPSSHDPSTTKGDINRDNKGNGQGDDRNHMGSTTMMGSTTPLMPPRHDDIRPASGSTTMPMPHKDDSNGSSTTTQHQNLDGHPTPPPPMPPTNTQSNSSSAHSYNSNGASNAASVIDALNEMGDGYSKLVLASLSMLGL